MDNQQASRFTDRKERKFKTLFYKTLCLKEKLVNPTDLFFYSVSKIVI